MGICDTNFYLDCQVRLWLWRIIPAVQIVFGTFGNILNVIILLRKRMKKLPTTVFLICLSAADMATLIALPLPKIFGIVLDIDVRTYSEILCRSSNMINYTSGGFSIWLLVILTLERMIMTLFPAHARNKLTRRKSVIIALSTLILTSLLSCHYLFGYKVQTISTKSSNGTTLQLKCQYLPTFAKFYNKTWTYGVLIGYNVIPAVFMFVGNAVILFSLLQQRRKFAAITPGEEGQKAKSHLSSKEKSATKLIFVISACFVVTTLPLTTNRVLKAGRKPTDGAGEARRLLLDDSLLILFYCNFSLNFLLYFVSGSVFKQEWKALVAELCLKFKARFPEQQSSTRKISTMSLSFRNTHVFESTSTKF